MMKRNKFFLVAIALLLLQNISASRLEKVFINMPDSLIPTLNKSMRLELIEYSRIQQKDTVKNVFGKVINVMRYDSVNNFLTIKTAENATMQIKILPALNSKNDTAYVIGVINTVCGPACSSYVNFYNSNWKKEDERLTKFTFEDWLVNKNEMLNGVKISQFFKSTLLEYRFRPDKPQIEVINNSLLLLNEEDKRFAEEKLLKENKILTRNVKGEWVQ